MASLIVLLPLIGFLINGLFGKRIPRTASGLIGSGAVGLSFGAALLVFFHMLGAPPGERSVTVTIFNWMSAGSFSVNVAYQLDQLSILMVLIVTGVGFLIHLYSIGYMSGDPGFSRFFA